MKFRVHGLHMETGDELDVVIDAPHPMAAAEKAQAMRIAVAKMEVELPPQAAAPAPAPEVRIVQAPPIQTGHATPKPAAKEGNVGKGMGLGFGAAIGWTTGIIATVVIGFVAMVFICGGLADLGRASRAAKQQSGGARVAGGIQTAVPGGSFAPGLTLEEVKLLGVAEYGYSWEYINWRVRISNSGPPIEGKLRVNLCNATGGLVLTTGEERVTLPTGTSALSFSTHAQRGASAGAVSANSVTWEER